MAGEKTNWAMCCLTSAFRTHAGWREKGMEKIFHANGNQMKAKVAMVLAIFIIRENRLIAKTIRYKGNHYIMIKELLQQENLTFVNIYAPKSEHLNINRPERRNKISMQ